MFGFMVVVRIYMYVGLALQLVLGLGDGLRVRFRLALGTGSKYPRWCFLGGGVWRQMPGGQMSYTSCSLTQDDSKSVTNRRPFTT